MKGLSITALVVCIALLTWSVQRWGGSAARRYRNFYTEDARARLQDIFLFINPVRLWKWALLLSLTFSGVVFAWTDSLVFAVLGSILVFNTPKVAIAIMRRRRYDMFEQQLPSAMLSLAATIRAGVGLVPAFQHLAQHSPAPLSQEISLVLREQRVGATFETALDGLRERIPSESCVLLVSTLHIAFHSGGNLAEACERIAHVLRERSRVKGKLKALTAQGRMQGWVAGFLPLVLLVVLTYLDAEAMSALWTTEIGGYTLTLIAVLEGAGMWLIHRISVIDV